MSCNTSVVDPTRSICYKKDVVLVWQECVHGRVYVDAIFILEMEGSMKNVVNERFTFQSDELLQFANANQTRTLILL